MGLLLESRSHLLGNSPVGTVFGQTIETDLPLEVDSSEFEPHLANLRIFVFNRGEQTRFPRAINKDLQYVVGKILETDDRRISLPKGLRQSCKFETDNTELSLEVFHIPLSSDQLLTKRILDFTNIDSDHKYGIKISVCDANYYGLVKIEAVVKGHCLVMQKYSFSGSHRDNLRMESLFPRWEKKALSLSSCLDPGLEVDLFRSSDVTPKTISEKILYWYLLRQSSSKNIP